MTSTNSKTLTIERTLQAPVQLVWKAWTQSEHIAKWWAPKGMELNIISHDFKVGGSWKYAMIMPNGGEFIAEGTYAEIVDLKKIISSADFKPMTVGVEIQAIFEEDGDKTMFTFHVVHPTEEYCKQQEEMGSMNGWGSVFSALEEHLTTLVD